MPRLSSVAALLLALALCLAGIRTSSAQAAAAIPTIGHGSRTASRVALTFDDNLNGPRSRAVLHILQSTGTKATVFVIGRNVLGNPSLTALIAAGGVEIGDHTMNHRRVTTLSPAGMASEIGGGTDAVRKLTGRRTAPLFRPPYGESNAAVAAVAAAEGFRAIVLWDVDTKDWQGRSAAAITRAAVYDARNGSIILMHLNAPHTYEALPGVIAGLKARGFQLVTVSELLQGRTGGSSTKTPAPPTSPKPALRPLTPDERAVLKAIDAGVMRPARGDRLSPDRLLTWSELGAMLARLPDLGRLPAPSVESGESDPTGGALVLRLDLAVALADGASDVAGYPVLRSESLSNDRTRFADVPAGLRGVVGTVAELDLMRAADSQSGPPRSTPTHAGALGPRFLPWAPVTRADVARACDRLLVLRPSATWAQPAFLLLTRVDPFWGAGSTG